MSIAMLTQNEVDGLRLKLLPSGADRVMDLVHMHRDQTTLTHVALENVPLLILARQGMIARLQIQGTSVKLSQPHEILKALQQFFTTPETLYIYTNLPPMPIPIYVNELIDEVADRVTSMETLRAAIDDALDQGDRQRFYQLSATLQSMNDQEKGVTL
ncbi:hypothetical protein B2M26_08015 [Ferroacidibacillus organovorans]|uniref:IDEAL domain-containing protein n=2 Tax=Ferroacidibacillus organovorans TaxID=1765683 RepID=A0A1V4ETI6_9BACL|nr:hypothetical protein B2M26_08015 [Ferroacidibacillus organovorans]